MSRKRVTRIKLADQITQLPDSVIDVILSCLPLQDAARTCILSKAWKDHWTRIGSLVFDTSFIEKFVLIEDEDDIAIDETNFVNIADSILSSHVGPIHKLHFEIPVCCCLDTDDLNVWISAARCGVQDLALKNEGEYQQCPSSIFQCKELKLLSLKTVHFDELPVCIFKNLPYLRTLELVEVDISGDMLSSIFISCPLLESFRLNTGGMTDLEDGPFSIEAPKLNLLSVTCSDSTTFILKNVSNISTLSLKHFGRPWESQEDVNLNSVQDIVSLCGAVPNVEHIDVNGYFLKQWYEQDIPEKLPAPLKNHRRFIIHDLLIYNPRQIRSMLCIIKGSPKLDTLQISLCDPFDDDSHDTEAYLQAQLSKVQDLWSLKSVRLTGLRGKKPEMLFIQLLLSCSSKLETLYFGSACNISRDVEFKMMTTITRFRRASAQAELIYLKPDTLL